MSTIAEFLLELSRNDELRAQFESDPAAAAREFGLDESKIGFLASGNLRELRIKIEGEIEIDGERITFFTIWWFQPPKSSA